MRSRQCAIVRKAAGFYDGRALVKDGDEPENIKSIEPCPEPRGDHEEREN